MTFHKLWQFLGGRAHVDVLPVVPLVCSLSGSSLWLHSAPSELHYQRCTSISPWRPSTCLPWCGRLLENICALNVVGFIVVEFFCLFVCLFHFLIGVGFSMSSGPTLSSCGGIEPLSSLLLIFLTGEKCYPLTTPAPLCCWALGLFC